MNVLVLSVQQTCFRVEGAGEEICGECDPNQKQNSGCRMNEVCLDNGKCQDAFKYVLFNQSCPSPDSQMCG